MSAEQIKAEFTKINKSVEALGQQDELIKAGIKTVDEKVNRIMAEQKLTEGKVQAVITSGEDYANRMTAQRTEIEAGVANYVKTALAPVL
eukprot:4934366-Karenia_brevis.AAC.1